MARDCAFPVLRDIFKRHSAVLSLAAVLLCKVPNEATPERCYTHHSESLNNILTRRKELFIKNDKGKQADLSKLQFATEVFQPAFADQIADLKAVLYGGSEYELTDSCKILKVTPDTWFGGEWTERQRQEYITKFNELTVKDVLYNFKTLRAFSLVDRCV